MERRTRYIKENRIKETIITHVEKNLKQYIIVSILFIIGMIIGVIFINNTSENQYLEITEYINSSINKLKNNEDLNLFPMLVNSIKNNLILAIILWFLGMVVIGVLFIYLIILFRGFCLGYTISSIIITLGAGKGTIFIISSLILQNFIFIPCIFALAISGISVYKNIMEDRRKENIKMTTIKHTIFSGLISLVLIIASLIEIYVSKNLLLFSINWM